MVINGKICVVLLDLEEVGRLHSLHQLLLLLLHQLLHALVSRLKGEAEQREGTAQLNQQDYNLGKEDHKCFVNCFVAQVVQVVEEV